MARDPSQYFRVEAREIVDGLGRGVLAIEKQASTAQVAELFRLAHTLKGAARVVKQAAIAQDAHALEDLLARLRDGGAPPGREDIDRLLAKVDAIAEQVRRLEAPPAQEAAAAAPPEEAPALGIDSGALDSLAGHLAEATRALAAVESALESVARAAEVAGALAEVRHARGRLREARDDADSLRLVPVSTLFLSLERAARDAAGSLGKRMAFSASGGDIRLEPSLLSALHGPLVQLVRNAVAHGIEPPSERTRAGKPLDGAVQIDVGRRGGRIEVACRDDGRGVDAAAVRRAAASRGVAVPAGATSDELLSLLLASGVTTSGSVTEVAGRGVGLDVVRATAQRLGGEVRMTTTPGRGTSFVLSVPASASSLEALLVDVGGHTVALPLVSVRQVLKLTESDVAHAANGDNVIHEGGLVPLIPLRLPMRLPPGRGSARARLGARLAIVVAAEGATPVAFEVDGIAGVSTIVAQPLPQAMPVDAVVSGAALDALGTPQLVLDPVQLVASAWRAGPVAPLPETAAPPPVLVVDDSLTTRMLEKSILETAGYPVDLATSAEEGLERARQRRYGLFLVDVEMPGMDGFGFVSTIRADPVLRDTPAILVTSRDAAEDRQRGRDVGANGYVVKGEFDQSALLAMIAELVR